MGRSVDTTADNIHQPQVTQAKSHNTETGAMERAANEKQEEKDSINKNTDPAPSFTPAYIKEHTAVQWAIVLTHAWPLIKAALFCKSINIQVPDNLDVQVMYNEKYLLIFKINNHTHDMTLFIY